MATQGISSVERFQPGAPAEEGARLSTHCARRSGDASRGNALHAVASGGIGLAAALLLVLVPEPLELNRRRIADHFAATAGSDASSG